MTVEQKRAQKLNATLKQLHENTKERKRLLYKIRELDPFRGYKGSTRSFNAKAQKVKDLVCSELCVSSSDMCSKSRRQDFALARQMVMYIMVHEFGATHDRAAGLFGLDHATSVHGCGVVRSLIEYKYATGKEPDLRRVKNPVSRYNKVLSNVLDI